VPRSREDYIGDGCAPSILEVIPEWHEQAACAVPPYDGWTWVMEPSNGRENAPSVLRCFAVCITCPVRRECLMDALQESRFTPVGVFGATTTTERQAAWAARLKEVRSGAGKVKSERNPEGISARVPHGALRSSERKQDAAEIADAFEDSYHRRVVMWTERIDLQITKSRAARKRAAATATVTADAAPLPASVCRRCGDRLPWRQRSDAAYCSAACKQAAYRARAA